MAHIPCPENHSRQLKPPPAIDEVERCAAPRWAAWRRRSPATQSSLWRGRLWGRPSRRPSRPHRLRRTRRHPRLWSGGGSRLSGPSVFLRDAATRTNSEPVIHGPAGLMSPPAPGRALLSRIRTNAVGGGAPTGRFLRLQPGNAPVPMFVYRLDPGAQAAMSPARY